MANGIYLNDIPLDVFLDYFKATNSNEYSVNEMLYENLDRYFKQPAISNNNIAGEEIYHKEEPSTDTTSTTGEVDASIDTGNITEEDDASSSDVFKYIKIFFERDIAKYSYINEENIVMVDFFNISTAELKTLKYLEQIEELRKDNPNIEDSAKLNITYGEITEEITFGDFKSSLITLDSYKNKLDKAIAKSDIKILDTYSDKEYFISTTENDLTFIVKFRLKPYRVPKVNNSGKYLYRDQYGLMTTESTTKSTFERHQNAIRRIFNGITSGTEWINKAVPRQLVILSEKNTEWLAYINKYTAIEEYTRNTPPEDAVISEDILPKIIFDNTNPGRTYTRATGEVIIPHKIKELSSFPEYNVYSTFENAASLSMPGIGGPIINIIKNEEGEEVEKEYTFDELGNYFYYFEGETKTILGNNAESDIAITIGDEELTFKLVNSFISDSGKKLELSNDNVIVQNNIVYRYDESSGTFQDSNNNQITSLISTSIVHNGIVYKYCIGQVIDSKGIVRNPKGSPIISPEFINKKNVIDNDINNSDEHNAILNIYDRSVSILKDSGLISVDDNDHIKVSIGFSNSLPTINNVHLNKPSLQQQTYIDGKPMVDLLDKSLLKKLKEGSYEVFDIKGTMPYILIPMNIDKKDLALTNSISLSIGTNSGKLVLNGYIRKDINVLSGLSISLIGENSNLKESLSILSGREVYTETEIIKDELDNIDDIYFIKVRLSPVTKTLCRRLLCKIKRDTTTTIEDFIHSYSRKKAIAPEILKKNDTIFSIKSKSNINIKPATFQNIPILADIKSSYDPGVSYESVTEVIPISTTTYKKDQYVISGQVDFSGFIGGIEDIPETIEYYRDPYSPSADDESYIKKTTTYTKNNATTDIIETDVIDIDFPNNTRRTIQSIYRENGRYFEDELYRFRGDYIPEDTFFKKRIESLSSTMKNILLKNDEEFNFTTECLKTDGLIRVYNYAKGFQNFVKNDFEYRQIITERELYKIEESINSRIILVKDLASNYTGSSVNNDLTNYTTVSKSFLERLANYKTFPTIESYKKRASLVNNYKEINSKMENNVNLKIHERNINHSNLNNSDFNSSKFEDIKGRVIDTIVNYINSGSKRSIETLVLTSPYYIKNYKRKIDSLSDSDDITDQVQYKKVYTIGNAVIEDIIKDIITLDNNPLSLWRIL